MKNPEIIEFLNGQWPPSVVSLAGVATDFDQDASTLSMRFKTNPGFCHSGGIVQGGFITAMLDAVMAYAALGQPGVCKDLATLEIKVSFLRVGRDGDFSATGRIVRAGRSIGYLDGQLFQNDQLIATATSTVKLIQEK